MVNRTDYSDDLVEAARSVLLELAHVLGAFRDHFALVGGWVPELLLPGAPVPPVGTLDVDVALNHRTLHEAGYATIHESLIARGYYQKPRHWPFQYWRKVQVGGHEYEVRVDFLAGEYEGTGNKHSSQKVLDMRPLKARGCDLAFEHIVFLRVSGSLPGGALDSAEIPVTNISTFLVMKAMALSDRIKEKDAWDIYRCVANYPGGPDALADEFRPLLRNGLVQEALHKIADKFASPGHYGPVAVADFDNLADPEDRDLRERDAYEQVHRLLEGLGIV